MKRLTEKAEKNRHFVSIANLATLVLCFLFILFDYIWRINTNRTFLTDCEINHYILTPVSIGTAIIAIFTAMSLVKNRKYFNDWFAF